MKKYLQLFLYRFWVVLLLFQIQGSFAQQFKVVGYIPNWGAGPGLISTMDYSKVTHINYSFLNPTDGSGTLDTWTPGLSELVTKAHAANVKVLVAIGGAGTSYDDNLRNRWLSCINAGNRGNFINNLSNFVTNNNLDGIDVDIEGNGINGDYSPFVNQLCDAIHAKGKLVTAAIKSDYGNPDLVTGCFAKLDFANVMCYDHTGNWDATPGQHSPYQYSIDMVNFFNSKGMPYSKMTFGVPFYGYGWNSDAGTWTYASVIAKYPGATNVDQAGNIIYYNGIQTIKDKTAWACSKGMGGMMIWELTNDVANWNTSLMKAIHDAMGACGSIPTISITSPANNATFSSPASITINANASVSSGSISKVEFFNNTTLLGSDNSAPYTFTWNNVAPGVYTIIAKATSNTGATASATITVKVKGPYGGTPWPIPGKVEAENYDEGGQGTSYNDNTTGNSGAAYRNEDVDIEPLAGSGYDVGYTAAGEWMKYSVNVAATGQYNFEFRIATTATGKSLHINMDGANVTGAVNLPNTGAWGTYQIVTVNNVALTQGLHEMQIYMDTDGFNIDYVNVTGLPSPTINFNSVTKTYGDAAFNVNATSNSTSAITYSITSGSAFASITPNGQVTIKGAGTVTIQANQAAGGGYNSGSATATLTINKAPLKITADNISKVYNTANPTLTMTYSGFVYGETSTAITNPGISTTAVTTSDAGTYPITLTGGSAANYSLTLVNGTLTINKATPTLSYTGATNGMQGSSISLTANSNSSGTISYSVSNGSGIASVSGNTLNLTQAGTVTLTVTVAASLNYTTASITQTITINALTSPTIVFGNLTKTYGDASFTMTASSNSTGGFTYSITAGSAFATITPAGQVTIKGAGTVTIQVSQAAAGSYNSGNATATLTINKAALTITADNKSKVYSTANPTLTMSYSGFVYGEGSTAIINPTIVTTATTTSDAGSYPISLTGGSAANYTLTLVNGTLTINKATPTLSYTGATNGTQGGTITLSATSNSNGTVSYSVLNGSGIASVSGNTLNLTQAGTVTLTVTVAASLNYTTASIQQTITINSLNAPTIVFDNLTRTYGDVGFNFTASSNSSGGFTYTILSGSQFITMTPIGQVTIKGAGTVTIQASQAAAGGFSSGSKTATLTINKAPLTITADSKVKVYNTANPALTMSYSGLVYGESSLVITNPSISTTATTSSDVGTYQITLSGGSAANYILSLVNGTININKATPNLSYTGATSGTQGTSINLSATSNSNGTISYSVSNGTGIASTSGSTLNLIQAGNIQLMVAIDASQNYTSASIQQTITINSLSTPTIIFDNLTKTYGDVGFNFTASSNSPGGFTYTVLSGSEFITMSPIGQVIIKGAGTITIQASQAAAGGFSAGSKTATLTINKAPLTITADNKSKVYNTVNPTLTMSYNGFVYGESSSVITNPGISTTATTSSNAGSYPISLTGGTSDNYIITLVNGTLTITKLVSSDLTYTGVTSGNENEILTLNASSTSTGTITYELLSGGTGSATISGNQLTLISEGVVTIKITIAGDANHETQVISQDITINKVTGINSGNSLIIGGLVNIYPNPIIDVARVEIEIPETSMGTLVLCDMNGKILQVLAEGTIEKQANYIVPMTEYSSGMYLIKLATDKGMLVKKITK